MALFHADKLLCCATAAGPAFEGAGISAGMPAASGAIRAVSLQDDTVHYETVQDAPAIGICGSGILDALAVMLETEEMDDSGYLEPQDEDAEDWANWHQRYFHHAKGYSPDSAGKIRHLRRLADTFG